MKEKSTLKMKFKSYVISPCENAKDRFDLFRKTGAVNKKGKDILKVIGYGYSFDDALLRIAAEETTEKEISTLQDYVREYKSAVREIKEILAV